MRPSVPEANSLGPYYSNVIYALNLYHHHFIYVIILIPHFKNFSINLKKRDRSQIPIPNPLLSAVTITFSISRDQRVNEFSRGMETPLIKFSKYFHCIQVVSRATMLPQ